MLHPKEKVVRSNEKVIYPDRREFTSEDILRVCDYIISDYSAIIIEACAIDVKVLLYLFDFDQYKKENGVNIDLFRELKGNASRDMKDLAKVIETNSYNMESYNKFKKKYLSVSDGTSTDKIIKLIEECL
jgi:CDP-glycerol glycerophosphotransferase (TagB/SpsB family)